MSLMNDALRKREKEKKHPSRAEIFNDACAETAGSKAKRYGILAALLIVCALAGYYIYQYISLNRPMTPAPSPALMPATPAEALGDQTPENTEKKDETRPASQSVVPAVQTRTPKAETESRPEAPAREASSPAKPKAATPVKTRQSLPPQMTPQTVAASASIPEPVVEPEAALPDPDPTPGGQPKAAPPPTTVQKAPPTAAANLFYRKALSYHHQNKLDLAIQMYRAALQNHPHDEAIRFNLAAAYIQEGAFAEALTILEDLKREDPENPEILLNQAVAEIGLDRPRQALDSLEEAQIKFDAPRFEVLLHKGIAQSRLGNFEKALAMYQKAEQISPGDSRVWMNTAIAYDHSAQFDHAVDYYRMSLDKDASLSQMQRREVETRIRELTAYLANKNRQPSETGSKPSQN